MHADFFVCRNGNGHQYIYDYKLNYYLTISLHQCIDEVILISLIVFKAKDRSMSGVKPVSIRLQVVLLD